jgi:hypothetical protein
LWKLSKSCRRKLKSFRVRFWLWHRSFLKILASWLNSLRLTLIQLLSRNNSRFSLTSLFSSKNRFTNWKVILWKPIWRGRQIYKRVAVVLLIQSAQNDQYHWRVHDQRTSRFSWLLWRLHYYLEYQQIVSNNNNNLNKEAFNHTQAWRVCQLSRLPQIQWIIYYYLERIFNRFRVLISNVGPHFKKTKFPIQERSHWLYQKNKVSLLESIHGYLLQRQYEPINNNQSVSGFKLECSQPIGYIRYWRDQIIRVANFMLRWRDNQAMEVIKGFEVGRGKAMLL